MFRAKQNRNKDNDPHLVLEFPIIREVQRYASEVIALDNIDLAAVLDSLYYANSWVDYHDSLSILGLEANSESLKNNPPTTLFNAENISDIVVGHKKPGILAQIAARCIHNYQLGSYNTSYSSNLVKNSPNYYTYDLNGKDRLIIEDISKN